MPDPSDPSEIEQWLHQKFPQMKRKFRNPTLTTINGIGPRFVGKRDFDAETGSWVTTHYFCLLFVPIFAMGAYRVVSSGDNTWQILGKEPISSIARKFNWALLAFLVFGSAGLAWNAHISSPEYQVGKALENAEAARRSGAPDKAMVLYEEILTNPQFPRKSEARAGYAASFNDSLEKLPMSQKQAAIESALVSRNLSPAPIADLAERVLSYVKQNGAEDPAGSAALLKTALPAMQASDAAGYRAAWRVHLEKAVTKDPANAIPAIDLAVILDAENKPEECRKLLEPHTARLGSTDGARVLGQILVRDGKFAEGAKLLQAYSGTRLRMLHSAEAKYDSVTKRIQADAIALLNGNRGPAGFYSKYNAASEAAQTELVHDFIRQHLKESKEVAAALADLESATPVVPVMLSLGVAQLNLAQASPDEQVRKKGLEDAEASFLSVEKSASGTDEYRLFLGQVSYWLGKHDEGRKLFDKFMTANGESSEKRLMVASVLRQLGALDESRALSEKAFEVAAEEPRRQAAAELRALTFIDNDDRIQWLSRAGNRKDVQISLTEAKGQKKLQEGDQGGAEELFRKALAGYEELPKSAAMLNNSANVLSTLYSLARDPRDFREAVNRREESSRLASRDTVLMQNLVTDWTTLIMLEAVEQMEGVDLKILPSGGAAMVAHLRHKNADEENRLMEQYQASETFRKARATCEQLLVLAPKDPHSFASMQSLALLVDDTDTLRSLRDRAAAVKFEHTAAWNEAKKFWKGEKDGDLKKTTQASLAEWNEALKAVSKSGCALAKVACRSVIRSLRESLSRNGEKFDCSALLAEAEALAGEQPPYATLRLAQDAHLAALIEELAAMDAAFAGWSKPLIRYLGSREIVTLAMERKLLTNDVANNGHFKTWLALHGKIRAAYPKKCGAANWALLRHVNPAMADEERIAAEKTAIGLLDSELDWLINPTSPASTLTMAWQEEMRNRPDHAAAILKDAAAHGMPLPQP